MKRPWAFKNSIGHDNKQAQDIINAIFYDLLDRRGIKDEIANIDDDILDEMYLTLTTKVAAILEKK